MAAKLLGTFLFCVYVSLTASLDSSGNFLPVIEPVEVDTSSKCADSSVIPDLTLKLSQINTCLTTTSFTSCQDVLDQCGPVSSGLYTIQSTSMYCDMVGSNCDDKGGWTRVVSFDSKDTSTSCPGDWMTEVIEGKRVCIDTAVSCASAFFSTNGISYSEVCGYVIGYQHGTPDAFGPQRADPNGVTLDGIYVDGISVTYSPPPRKHIWTHVGGVTETGDSLSYCPCNINSRSMLPAFIKGNYYCESGVFAGGVTNQLYPDDPLWDGKNCGGLEGGCCTNPKMPYWYRNLNETALDDIEIRLCNNGGDEAPVLEMVEIFVR